MVPKGMVSKDEVPENVGLIYYNPENKSLRKVRKALHRKDIEEPVGVYKYIVYSRLEQDRIPFYEKRAEYARDYLEDQKDKKYIGDQLGSKLSQQLSEQAKELDRLQGDKYKIDLFNKIEKLLKKHKITKWGWWRNDEELLTCLDEALSSSYPKELDSIRANLQRAVEDLDKIKGECSTNKNEEMEE